MFNLELKAKTLYDTGMFVSEAAVKNYLSFLMSCAKEETAIGCQLHHILPRKYFIQNKLPVDNSDSNLVRLLYKDHIKAHYLLSTCTTGYLHKANLAAARSLLAWFPKYNSKPLMDKDFEDLQNLYENLSLKLTYNAIYNYYVLSNHTKKEAVDYFNCSVSYFNTKCREYGISKTLYYTPSREELYQYYIEQKHTLKETAEHFNCCTAKLITLNKKYGIAKYEQHHLRLNYDEVRNYFVDQNHTKHETAKYFNLDVSKLEAFLANHHIIKKERFSKIKTELTEEFLYELYINQNKTRAQIAADFNCSEAFIKKLLLKFGIQKVGRIKNVK